MSQNPRLTVFIISLSTVLIIVYSSLITRIRKGLGKPVDSGRSGQLPFLSVVVPFRNEEPCLPGVIECLAEQAYPHYEVILVNDHSTDASVGMAGSKIGLLGNFQLWSLPAGATGKKQALNCGIGKARGEIIVQTDADCRMGKDWLLSIAHSFAGEVRMLAAPVKMIPQRSWVSKFAALEFLSLQGSGLGLIGMKKPVMVSAANLAYRKNVFEELRGIGSEKASGDDVFLLQGVAKKYGPEAIAFTTHKAAIVETVAPGTWKEFFRQRVRWGGKSGSYPSAFARFLAGFVAFYCVWMIGVLAMGFFRWRLLIPAFGLLFLKALADYFLLNSFARRTGQEKFMHYFPLSVIVYPFYILITGVLITFFPQELKWKERAISPRKTGN